MEIKIKEIDKSDYPILKDFIYWAIFTSLGVKLPERNIIYNPDVFIYIENLVTRMIVEYLQNLTEKQLGQHGQELFPHIDILIMKLPNLQYLYCLNTEIKISELS